MNPKSTVFDNTDTVYGKSMKRLALFLRFVHGIEIHKLTGCHVRKVESEYVGEEEKSYFFFAHTLKSSNMGLYATTVDLEDLHNSETAEATIRSVQVKKIVPSGVAETATKMFTRKNKISPEKGIIYTGNEGKLDQLVLLSNFTDFEQNIEYWLKELHNTSITAKETKLGADVYRRHPLEFHADENKEVVEAFQRWMRGEKLELVEETSHPDKDHKIVQCEELNDAVQEILRLDNGEVTDTELQQLERLRKRFYQLHDEIDDPVITASHSGTCWKDMEVSSGVIEELKNAADHPPNG